MKDSKNVILTAEAGMEKTDAEKLQSFFKQANMLGINGQQFERVEIEKKPEGWTATFYGEKTQEVSEAPVEEEEVVEQKEKVDDSWTIDELKQYCKDNGLHGYSKYNHDELVEAINNNELEAE